MKMITATEANRDFSKLLEEVTSGVSIGVTKHGKVVATINPVKSFDDEAAKAAVRSHLEFLRQQPLLGIPRGTRDELYDD
jgi:prevent-host-death family protein